MTSNFMNLKVYTPTELVLEEQIVSFTFTERTGSVCLKPNHIDYISSFTLSTMVFVNINNEKKIIVANNGILIKCGRDLKLSSYVLEIGSDLENLKLDLEKKVDSEMEMRKQLQKSLKNLEYHMFKRIMELNK